MTTKRTSKMSKRVAAAGRDGDTLLAHLRPKAVSKLKSMGGRGTINPKTGLKEYPIWMGPALAGMGLMSMGGASGGAIDRENAMYDNMARQGAADLRTWETEEQRKNKEREAQRNQQNRGTFASSNARINDLTPQELMEQSQRLLSRDQARFAGYRPPQYTGSTVAPISPLTQKAQTLQSQYNSQPAPYAPQINNLMTRPNTGFNVDGLLQLGQNSQNNFITNHALGTLKNNLGAFGAPIHQSFQNTAAREGVGTANVARANYNNLNAEAENLQGSLNESRLKAFRDLANNTQLRRNTHLEALTGMGQQAQAHENMRLGGEKAAFNEEAYAPFAKMNKFGNVLNAQEQNINDDTHPDLIKPMSRHLMSALNAYGVDLTKPVKDWDMGRLPTEDVFAGNRTAPLPPEILASHNVMNRFSPALFRGDATDERERLEKEMMKPGTIGDRAFANVPAAVNPIVAENDNALQRIMARSLKGLSGKYISRGGYGNKQHLNDVEEYLTDSLRERGGKRFSEYGTAISDQLKLQKDRELNDISRLNTIGKEEQNSFNDTMQGILDSNKLGAEKWSNAQANINDQHNNFYASSPWNAPGMGSGVNILGGTSPGMGGSNIRFDNPSAVNNIALGSPGLAAAGSRYNDPNSNGPSTPLPQESNEATAKESAMTEGLRRQYAQIPGLEDAWTRWNTGDRKTLPQVHPETLRGQAPAGMEEIWHKWNSTANQELPLNVNNKSILSELFGSFTPEQQYAIRNQRQQQHRQNYNISPSGAATNPQTLESARAWAGNPNAVPPANTLFANGVPQGTFPLSPEQANARLYAERNAQIRANGRENLGTATPATLGNPSPPPSPTILGNPLDIRQAMQSQIELARQMQQQPQALRGLNPSGAPAMGTNAPILGDRNSPQMQGRAAVEAAQKAAQKQAAAEAARIAKEKRVAEAALLAPYQGQTIYDIMSLNTQANRTPLNQWGSPDVRINHPPMRFFESFTPHRYAPLPNGRMSDRWGIMDPSEFKRISELVGHTPKTINIPTLQRSHAVDLKHWDPEELRRKEEEDNKIVQDLFQAFSRSPRQSVDTHGQQHISLRDYNINDWARYSFPRTYGDILNADTRAPNWIRGLPSLDNHYNELYDNLAAQRLRGGWTQAMADHARAEADAAWNRVR